MTLQKEDKEDGDKVENKTVQMTLQKEDKEDGDKVENKTIQTHNSRTKSR